MSQVLALSFLLCVLFTLSVAEEPKTYEGYQVFRFSLLGNKTSVAASIRSVYTIADKYMLDIWASNAIEGWMDVMIPPHLLTSAASLFSAIPYTVSVPDVQQLLDQSALEVEAARDEQDFFSTFQTYGAISNWLQAQTSSIARRISVGSSYAGSNVYALHMGEDPTQAKPAVFIHCGIHAREWITQSSCCWFIDQILHKDPESRSLLDHFEIVILPVLNVDGYDFTWSSNRLWRKNRQPNNGYPNCPGTDLNRNFPWGWSGPGASNNPCAETYYGTAPFSGVENNLVKNVVERFTAEGRLASYWDIHAYSALWMSAWGSTCGQLPPDYPAMRDTMEEATNAVYDEYSHTYAYGSICQTIYQASGGTVDWVYGDQGVIHSYTTEAWGTNFSPPPSYIPIVGQETWAGVKKTLQIIRDTQTSKQ